MKPTESFTGQPIRSLQTMLRVLGEQNDCYKTLIPDGIYGPDTMSAVRIFQQHNRLPITGVVDQLTWDAVVEAYEIALIELILPQTIQVLLEPNASAVTGENPAMIYLAQVMLTVLAESYHCLIAPAVTGKLDAQTRDALEMFQQLSGLPITGQLDRHTWRHLALQFPTASNLPTEES